MRLVLLFLLINSTSVVWCKFDYCKDMCINYPAIPLTCKCEADPGCSSVFNESDTAKWNEFRQAMLDGHNKLRNQFALASTPLETEHGFTGASNMLAFSYDYDLEYTARCHTRICVMGHHCVVTEKYSQGGQNLHASSEVPTDAKAIAEESFRGWYDKEIVHVTKETAEAWKTSFFSTAEPIGHFSQIVWAETRAVGCWASKGKIMYFEDDKKKTGRKAKGSLNMIVTCAYGPAGNIINTPMYEAGPGASKCPPGEPVNSKYQGLCGKDEMPSNPPTYSNSPPTQELSRFALILMITLALCKFYNTLM